MKFATFLRFATALLVLWSAPSWAQMTFGKIHSQERRGAWSSFILEFPTSINFRATAPGSDPSVLLTLDFFADTCDSNISFIFPFGAPLEENAEAVKVHIDARIDSGNMYYLAGSFMGVMGDSHGQIALLPSNSYSELLDAMKAGNTARFRVAHTDGEHLATVSFSLIGFTYSYNRMLSVCDATKKRFGPGATTPSSPSPSEPRKNDLHKLI